jgi:hypothetical protein
MQAGERARPDGPCSTADRLWELSLAVWDAQMCKSKGSNVQWLRHLTWLADLTRQCCCRDLGLASAVHSNCSRLNKTRWYRICEPAVLSNDRYSQPLNLKYLFLDFFSDKRNCVWMVVQVVLCRWASFHASCTYEIMVGVDNNK